LSLGIREIFLKSFQILTTKHPLVRGTYSFREPVLLKITVCVRPGHRSIKKRQDRVSICIFPLKKANAPTFQYSPELGSSGVTVQVMQNGGAVYDIEIFVWEFKVMQIHNARVDANTIKRGHLLCFLYAGRRNVDSENLCTRISCPDWISPRAARADENPFAS
jgi:hypothetical protein